MSNDLFNISSFAIPGLFAPSSPNAEAQLFAFPDGSVAIKIYEDEKFKQLGIKLAHSAWHHLKTRDWYNNVFVKQASGTFEYWFVLQSAPGLTLPGMLTVEVWDKTNNDSEKFLVTIRENLFNPKIGHGHTCASYYALTGYVPLAPGAQSVYIPYYEEFDGGFETIIANVRANDGTPDPQTIYCFVTAATGVGFRVEFETPIPDTGNYFIAWAVFNR